MPKIFTPTTAKYTTGTSFGDKRLEARCAQICMEIAAKQSCVINQFADGHAARTAAYRFFNNSAVKVSQILGELSRQYGLQDIAGRHLLIPADTTEISLKHAVGHTKNSGQVGRLSDNKTPGFLAHTSVVLDAQTGAAYGIGDITLINRVGQATQEIRTAKEKESYKWQLGMQNTEQLIGRTQSATFVFDAEADAAVVLGYGCELPEGRDVVIRAHRDRRVWADGEYKSLQAAIEECPLEQVKLLNISAISRKNSSKGTLVKRKRRVAALQVKYRKVGIEVILPDGEKEVRELYVVRAQEAPESVPKGERPIEWCLLTTHVVRTIEQGERILRWYEWRWTAEDFFRLLKHKGFRIEECRLEDFEALVKLVVLTFITAVDVLRLYMAREIQNGQRLNSMFSAAQIELLRRLNAKYEGRTAKQKNPYAPDQLAYASWIIGRMGGWKGYISQGPPGIITLKRGYEQLKGAFFIIDLIKTNDAT